MRALVIPPGIEPVHGVEVDGLERLQELVAGDIEALVTARPELNVYINEEGKANGLERNSRATLLMHSNHSRDDYVAGTAVVLGPVDSEGNDLDVTVSVAEELLAPRWNLGPEFPAPDRAVQRERSIVYEWDIGEPRVWEAHGDEVEQLQATLRIAHTLGPSCFRAVLCRRWHGATMYRERLYDGVELARELVGRYSAKAEEHFRALALARLKGVYEQGDDRVTRYFMELP